MLKVAVYGKGGIGKSTITSNLAAAFAAMGKKVIQIGCDPKADSTINLLGGEPLRPVMNFMREEDEEPERLEDISKEGFGGVLCIETGGPTPGLGCAGRGIIATFQLLEDLKLFETYKPDVVLYDVLGDVVCGGFAAPIREGYAEKVLIVTSGEKMALYAANNISSAVRNFEDRSYARIFGIVLNHRNVENETEKVQAFAEKSHIPIVNIPPQFISGAHLIYSSPATLAFNSPGAEGFGVKRAGLAIPDSIMLIVAPGCCGRNTSLISSMREYDQRFFYLMMDETDIVTGRHLKKIPKAVKEICDSLEKKPSVVMICITCVDALLGTDMERVCRKAEEAAGLPVRPCYMYALTREGRKPPMVHVRQSLYSLLEPRKKKGNVVNLLGFFSPLVDDCELYDLLHQAGVKTIHEISACRDYEEYQTMSEANFNLVLHPEARFAAEDFHDRLKIPFIELTRLYQIDKIGSQYRAFGKVLGVTFDDQAAAESAQKAVDAFRVQYPEASFAVGECMNGDAFELSLALVRYGFKVPEIYGTITAENFIYIKQLAAISPETRVYSNMEPTMLYYDGENSGVNMAIGKDAAYYHQNCPNVMWNQDRQPYGYAGVRRLFEALTEAENRWEEQP